LDEVLVDGTVITDKIDISTAVTDYFTKRFKLDPEVEARNTNLNDPLLNLFLNDFPVINKHLKTDWIGPSQRMSC
jgi:hypothetical protein